ncbi:ABC transporter ATP-binding protein [Alkalinema sp. FACHB-956]|uniref:ATP-binding cassette domain-containing protein n=1 Tax=Alkalinema sp. FACHB-956 TaxID=2692768 RepID=UPI001685BF3A|nr:ABC transporter ATP-binding protein [Alkalinema sp. FACHB-956]
MNSLTQVGDGNIILQLEAVTKQFAQAAFAAVQEISIDLQEGDLLGLLGPSGCGKTTLLRMIAGFEQPSAGQIMLAGQVVATPDRSIPPEKRDVGMVFQDYALFPHLTAGENIRFGLTKLGLTRAEQTDRVRDAIGLVGLEGLEKRYPHQLSGGQQQRVALARALAPRPQLILLDEPLSNLDAQVRLRLRQEIRSILKQAGISAVFVTHDQEEALSICDRVAVLSKGCLEQLGTPEEIYQYPATRFVAEFVTQANFVQAVQQEGQWVTDFGEFPIVPPGKTNSHPSTAQATLMIRQEDVQLSPDRDGNFKICDREFLGREYRYRLVNAAGLELYARSSDRIAPEDCVTVKVRDNRFQIFP